MLYVIVYSYGMSKQRACNVKSNFFDYIRPPKFFNNHQRARKNEFPLSFFIVFLDKNTNECFLSPTFIAGEEEASFGKIRHE